jgi:hypothetical protein
VTAGGDVVAPRLDPSRVSYRVTEDRFCGCSNVFLPERHSNIIQLHYIVHEGLILSIAQLPIDWWPCRTRLSSIPRLAIGGIVDPEHVCHGS